MRPARRATPILCAALAACASAQPAPITTTTTTVAPQPVETLPDVAPAPIADAATSEPETDAGPWLTGDERRAAVMAVVERYHDVAGCWSDALERQGNHASEAARVALDVDTSGHATVHVDGVSDGALGECVRVRLAGHRYGAGEAVTTDASYDLAPGG